MRAVLLILCLLLAGCTGDTPAAADDPDPVEPAGEPAADPTPASPTPRPSPRPSPTPASPTPAPAPRPEANATSEEPAVATRVFEQTFTLKLTEARTEVAMSPALGPNCVSLSGDVPWSIVSGVARVEWTAQTPAFSDLSIVAGPWSGDGSVRLAGPSPLELAVPTATIADDRWVLSVNAATPGVALEQPFTVTLSLVVAGGFEAAEGTCSVS